MNNKKFLIVVMLMTFLLIIFLFVFIVTTFDLLLPLFLGIILFFIVLGVIAGVFDYFDHDENDQEFNDLEFENSTAENEKINLNLKNNRYRRKKKHRKRYYREHIGKRFKESKCVLSKEKYYKKTKNCAKPVYTYITGHNPQPAMAEYISKQYKNKVTKTMTL